MRHCMCLCYIYLSAEVQLRRSRLDWQHMSLGWGLAWLLSEVHVQEQRKSLLRQLAVGQERPRFHSVRQKIRADIDQVQLHLVLASQLRLVQTLQLHFVLTLQALPQLHQVCATGAH